MRNGEEVSASLFPVVIVKTVFPCRAGMAVTRSLHSREASENRWFSSPSMGR